MAYVTKNINKCDFLISKGRKVWSLRFFLLHKIQIEEAKNEHYDSTLLWRQLYPAVYALTLIISECQLGSAPAKFKGRMENLDFF